jgi:hypothetical protein
MSPYLYSLNVVSKLGSLGRGVYGSWKKPILAWEGNVATRERLYVASVSPLSARYSKDAAARDNKNSEDASALRKRMFAPSMATTFPTHDPEPKLRVTKSRIAVFSFFHLFSKRKASWDGYIGLPNTHPDSIQNGRSQEAANAVEELIVACQNHSRLDLPDTGLLRLWC